MVQLCIRNMNAQSCSRSIVLLLDNDKKKLEVEFHEKEQKIEENEFSGAF